MEQEDLTRLSGEQDDIGANKSHILVVDDDAMNLFIAKRILSAKFDVDTVSSGKEAFVFLEKNETDLILLDIEMPIMSGIKTLEIIRENPELAKIPVMFLTAAADAETVMEAGNLGVIDYVKKPFLPEELSARVKRAVE